MFNPRQLSYLGGEGDDPSGIPDRAVVPDNLQFLGMGGIKAYQADDTVHLALSDELQQQINDAAPPAAAVDPFANMGFRCKWVDGDVQVKQGYVAYTTWVEGTRATAHATITGDAVTSITIDNAGADYPVAPRIVLEGGGGAGAKATATIDGSGAITGYTVTDGGTGYTSAPTVTIKGSPGKWKHTTYSVAEELVAAIAFPYKLYLAVPVKKVQPLTDDGSAPVIYYNGEATGYNIEGSDYFFFIETAVYHTTFDSTPPGSFFFASASTPTPSATVYYHPLADVPDERVVQQRSFGDITLPQIFYPNIISFSVE